MATVTTTKTITFEYRAEYAKTGRAACKGCKELIPGKSLKIGRLVQSHFHDGKDAQWHHVECLFKKQKPASADMIENIGTLRWEDQVALRNRFASGAANGNNGVSKGKKTRNNTNTVESGENSEAYEVFGVQYAKSSRSSCIACERKIENKEIRIWKMDSSAEAMMRGQPIPRYHHVDCFHTVGEKLGFPGEIKMLPGFDALSDADKKTLTSKFKNFTSENLKRKFTGNGLDEKPSKLAKTEENEIASSAVSTSTSELSTKTAAANVDYGLLKKQIKVIYTLRDFLQGKLERREIRAADLVELLEENGQESGGGLDVKLDRLTDVMVFGALLPCELCKGQYVFKSGVGYECSGNLSAFTKCADVKLDPKRSAFVIPENLKNELNGYKFKKVSNRIIELISEVPKVEVDGGFVKIDVTTLAGFKIYISPVLAESTVQKLSDLVTKFDGEVVSELDASVTAIVSTAAEVKKNSPLMLEAQKHEIPVVRKEFLESFKTDKDLIEHTKKNIVSGWTAFDKVVERIKSFKTAIVKSERGSRGGKKRRHALEKEVENVKLQLKDGGVVDPECPVADHTRVLKKGKVVYSVVLKRTDVDANVNSYYKLQALVSDTSKEHYVYRSWGRVGTKIGGQTLDEDLDMNDAIEFFKAHYKDKTGNEFGKPFVMKPGMYMLLDVSYDSPAKQELSVTKKSKLPLAVQHLICLIFDVKRMMSTLVEFEIDTGKMPLGKISRDQVLKAFTLLDNLSKALNKPKFENVQRVIIDYSNQFFSLIPHNLGIRPIPVLNDMAMVREKILMLEQLMEIELAYEMIREPSGSNANAVDNHYERLNALIVPLEKNSVDYDIIQQYLKNTHAATHSQYGLKIQHVYKVNRNGEKDKFEAFNKLKNHKLLWHGSRTTNFAGILSQGLRIAPPEAPVTGYMFGKGIYFADMVSKSANYCYPSRDSSSGLLLLCQVALGESKRLTSAKDTLLKAPKGYQSVLGVGQTHPDPKTFTTLDKDILVPYGTPVNAGIKTDLLYNEYIVYDVAQVSIRYILNLEFEYK